MQRLKPPTHHLPHRLDLHRSQHATAGERHVAGAGLGPGVGSDMRLGEDDDGTEPLGLEPMVRTGDDGQSRRLGGGQKKRLNRGEIVERMGLGSTDLVADRTQAHRTHASTVATWPEPDKRGELPIHALPAPVTHGRHTVIDGASGLFTDSTPTAPIHRAVAIGP